MVKKKWCGFHKRMEPIGNFYPDVCSPTGYQNGCKEIQNKRVMISQEKRLLKSLLKKGIISEKTFLVEKEVLKQKYGVK